LVRGPDFNDRYQRRVPSDAPSKILEIVNSPFSDHVNMGRAIENSRLLASIAVAQWRLFEIKGDNVLITNDLGYAGMMGVLVRETGIAIPLGQGHILAIVPKARRIVAVERHGRWTPSIDRHRLPINNHIALNKILAGGAQRFIFGEDESIVGQYLFREEIPPRVPEPIEYGFVVGKNALTNNLKWQELVLKLSEPPRSRGATIRMDLLEDSPVPPWGMAI
jgi:hypothetical protein